MTVDQTWQNQIIAMRNGLLSRRRRALPDRGDGLAAYPDVTLAHDGVGGDNGSGDNAIEWR